MSSERGGLLKARAEDFARHLQTRLRSLGQPEDNSWAEVSSTDSEIYYDIDSSLASPQEEVTEPIFISKPNKGLLSLQHSESSGSEYFDSEDTIEDVTSVPAPQRLPIPYLKTDVPASVTNGYTNLLGTDLGCSKIREVPFVEVDLCKNDRSDCDSNVLENNNSWKDNDEVADRVLAEQTGVECNCDVDTLHVDTRQEVALDGVDPFLNSSCVFCDIEQIKSNISNKSVDVNFIPEQTKSTHTENEELYSKKQLICHEINLNEDGKSGEYSSSDEENVPLTDLLKVLKNEITKESDQNEETPKCTSIENNDLSELIGPRIEIKESSPSLEVQETLENTDDEAFDIEEKRKHFRRCSSLKSGKTPPGTPGRKKIVRFADVLGLDLADVKTFLDEVPTIPKSAYEDLHGFELSSSPVKESPLTTGLMTNPHPDKILVPLFQQPCVQPNFMDRVRERNVCLENAAVSDMFLFAISGLVRVKNIDFHKSVHVRYTINGWRSFSDLQARYVPNSYDGFSDKFSFTLYAHTLSTGQRLEFAIRFQAGGTQFWDNNGGVNYIFECQSIGPPKSYMGHEVPPSPIETWASFC